MDPDALPTWHGLPYVTAMLKGRHCEFALRGGDATQGGLRTLYVVRPLGGARRGSEWATLERKDGS